MTGRQGIVALAGLGDLLEQGLGVLCYGYGAVVVGCDGRSLGALACAPPEGESDEP